MLKINIQKIAEKCKAENLFQLSKLLGWTAPTVYKYTHPERVKALFLDTLSQIVKEIARNKKIKPDNVRFGDIFDWQDEP